MLKSLLSHHRRILLVCCLLLVFTYVPIRAWASADSYSTIKVEEHSFRNDELEMAYLLYLPENYNPENGCRLVLFMHGAGDRGFDFEMLHRIDYGFVTTFLENDAYHDNTILLVPQCPVPYLWVEDSWASGAYTMTSQPSPAILAVKQLCDYVIQAYSVDRTRVYAVGVSMGGMAVWDMLGRYPYFFAAAAPVCGCLDESKIAEYSKTPIFTANDIRDNIVGAEPTARVMGQLKALGADVVYKQYDTDIRNDSTYHSTWIDAFSLDKSEDNLYNYIFSHQRELPILGDTDGNGKVQTNDAKLVLQHIVKMPVELNLDAADVDGNGKVQTNDAKLILQYIVKIINKFPVEIQQPSDNWGES